VPEYRHSRSERGHHTAVDRDFGDQADTFLDEAPGYPEPDAFAGPRHNRDPAVHPGSVPLSSRLGK